VYLSLQGTPDLAAADRTLGHALETSERTDARDAIVGPIVQLMAGHADMPGIADGSLGVTADDMAESALAAALGLIVGDVIPAPMLEVLYRPFSGLIPLEDIERDVV